MWRGEKSGLYWDLNALLAVQPIVSQYADYAIPAHTNVNPYQLNMYIQVNEGQLNMSTEYG
jgi:hypothetical protein